MATEAPSGMYVANMKEAMQRLEEYVKLAEAGRFTELYEKIEVNTRDPVRHPNQIIFGVALILGAMRGGTGRSFIPVIRAAGRRWSTNISDMFGIWHT